MVSYLYVQFTHKLIPASSYTNFGEIQPEFVVKMTTFFFFPGFG